MEYFEEEFEISTRKDLKFKFKELSALDVLALSDEYVNYLGMHDTKIYKSYVDDILKATSVCINGKWYPVKEGNNYYPANFAKDFKGLREIVNQFFNAVISPVFLESNESSTEQE